MAAFKAFRVIVLVLAVAGSAAAAERPVSYAKDIRPFLAKYCSECHSGQDADGELNLESYAAILKGGSHGPALVPGKADASRMVRMVEGTGKPVMPPRRSLQPKPEEKALLRAWVHAGAKDDSTSTKVELPALKPLTAVPAPVTALAYHPNGLALYAVADRSIAVCDPKAGEATRRLDFEAEQRITALACSPLGQPIAVAEGAAGVAGRIVLLADSKRTALAGHQDLVQDLAFSPDGKLLASCGYDRLVKLWEVSTGKLIQELRDHSDAVYGVSFSPDGKLLATGGADRAVKVWDVATGKRLYTLGENTDWVYAVAWSPKGNLLAAGGVDRSIRVWEATGQSGRVVHSVFAHEGPIVRLAYSNDGGTLCSLSEDRTAKAWDTSRMVERLVFPAQPDTPLSLGVRKDNAQIAIGRYDGALVLLDAATGKPQSQPLPVKPKPPELKKATPPAGPRGQNLKLRLEGLHLASVSELTTTIPGAKATLTPAGDAALDVALSIPATTPAGQYQLAVKNPAGTSANLPFTVDLFPAIPETDGNDVARTAQAITLPVTIAGAIGRAGDLDLFRIEARAGEEIGVQVVAGAPGSKLDPVLTLSDSAGQLLAESSNGLLGHRARKAGVLFLGLRDREYRGEPAMIYRLHVGPVPIVTAVFPTGLRRGTEQVVQLEGVHLGERSVKVAAPADAEPGRTLPVPVASPLGPVLGDPKVVVGEYAESVAGDSPLSLATPGTGNGRLDRPGATQTWRFAAKKGQRLIVETHARRLGSPIDTAIEILDGAGRPVPVATLRAQAKTHVHFRDHDSNSTGIRIETWSELAVNDFLLVGNELIRIRALPRNPDDDCQFFSENGRRVGFLGTTPTHQAMGLPMYKVAIHPPGTNFPPNGLPVVTLYHRNDDGGPRYDKDSFLYFDPPADGDYQVRVGDARAQGGPEYVYRLTVRPPRPSFNLSVNPTMPTLAKGEGVPIEAKVERIDGFNGPIQVRVADLPPGFSAPATTILPDDSATSFTLFAEPNAEVPAGAKPWKLSASATVDGQTITREIVGALPRFRDAADIVTTTDQSAVSIRPGGEARITVHVERRNNFKGRIPLDVKGLPHGVRVLDVGLNGILITERDTSRVVVLAAEPWVQPTEHPIVILARREGKGTEHAARSVLLRVTGR